MTNAKKEPDENIAKPEEINNLPNDNFSTKREKSQAYLEKVIDNLMKTLLESTEFYSREQQMAFDIGRAYSSLESLRERTGIEKWQ